MKNIKKSHSTIKIIKQSHPTMKRINQSQPVSMSLHPTLEEISNSIHPALKKLSQKTYLTLQIVKSISSILPKINLTSIITLKKMNRILNKTKLISFQLRR